MLFCANHPNSLIDPVLIGIAAKRPVSFMAKAPLFETPLLGPVIKALGMVPAYRGRDDARQVKKNTESLAQVAAGLQAGRAMGIFPEGVSSDTRQLGLVRGGAARIALQAYERNVTDLVIIPLGINYDSKEKLGSKVWIQVGKPICIGEMVQAHHQNTEDPVPVGEDKVLRRDLTSTLESRLKEVVVHLDNAEWDPLLTNLESIVHSAKHKPSVQVPALMRRKRIADAINYFYEKDPDKAQGIIDQVKSYHQRLHRAGLVIDDPILNHSRIYAIFTFLWQFAVLLIWFLPATFGAMMNMVPFLVTRKVAALFQDEGKKTIATWRLLIGIPIYLIWYGLIYATVFFETEELPMAMIMNFMLPVTGTIALRYWAFFGKSMQHMGHQFRTLTNRKQLHQLRDELSAIRQTLVQYADQYAEISPRPKKIPTVKPFMMLFAKMLGTGFFLAIALLIYVYAANLIKTKFIVRTSQPNPLIHMSATDVQQAQQSASKKLVTIERAYRGSLQEARNLLAGFVDGTVKIENQQDSDQIQGLLRRFCTYRDSLLQIVLTYKSYQNQDIFTDPQSRDRALTLFVAATLLRHEMSANFIDAHDDYPRIRDLLNRPETRWGIPPDVFDTVQRELLDTSYRDMVFAAEHAYEQNVHDGQDENRDSALHQIILEARAEIANLPKFGIRADISRTLRDAKENAEYLYKQIQTFAATVAGDVRVNQRGIDHLIRPAHLQGFHEALRPGDILIERRDWYTSNAFLPGFWPHGAMYVGTVDEMKQDGIYEQVCDEIRQLAAHDEETGKETGNEASVIHAQKLRAILAEFEKPAAENQYQNHHVIEAVSEGVILNTIEHSAGEATSVCAFRPTMLTKAHRAKAIAMAYYYLGRDYDFDFDFDTTNTLVCTEVVYRCYEGNRKGYPLQFNLSTILGRRTLPAQNIIEQYIKEVQDPQTQNQLELVVWIDTDRLAQQTSRLYLFNGDTSGPDHEFFTQTLDRPSLTWEWERRRHGIKAMIKKPTEVMFYICFGTTMVSVLYYVTITRRRRKKLLRSTFS